MDTVRCIDNEDFLSGNFEYDFNNPPENKKGYLALREKLIQDVQDLKNLRKYKKYVDELQSQGIISEIKLPDVEDTPKSEQQLQRDAFKNKIWKKIKKMF